VLVGVTFPADETTSPLEFGLWAEERGVESIWFHEHSHIPVSRETPFPGNQPLAPQYLRFPDPFVCLAAIASVTDTVRLGTGLCLLTQRDPITTAKEAATLDVLSGGRFEFGVGAGWNAEEMRNHGTDPAHRFAVLCERVDAIRAIWTNEEAEFHGRHVDFDPIWSFPKPLQQPSPPILLAGDGPKSGLRAMRHGDGWITNAGVTPHDVLLERARDVQQRLRAAGRPALPITIFSAPYDVTKLRELAEVGVVRVVTSLRPTVHDEPDPTRLERFLEIVTEVEQQVTAS
jgi:probable F420-dependent oxidoreductase